MISNDHNKISNLKIVRRSNKQLFLRSLLGALVIILVASVGMLAGTVSGVVTKYNNKYSQIVPNNNVEKLTLKEVFSETINEVTSIALPIQSDLNILFLGSDVGYTYSGKKNNRIRSRSDTMMLAHFDSKERKVNILSIPRDTRIVMPRTRRYDKINSAYVYGGQKLAKQAVANLSGAVVHRYVSLKVDGLINIVDVIGGIEIDVEKRMYYVDKSAGLYINIPKGKQTLNGRKAQHYVRYRHDSFGDIGRVQRQQKFLQAVLAKLLSPSTLVKLPEIIRKINKNISTDLTAKEIIQLANYGKELNRSDLKMVMLPGNFSGEDSPISYWLMNKRQAKKVIANMFPDSIYNNNEKESSDINKRLYKITVTNGTRSYRLASRGSKLLKEDNWRIWSVHQARKKVKRTQIIVQTGRHDIAESIKETLGIDAEIVDASVGDIYSDFTLILGDDFAEYLKEKEKEKINVKT